MAVDTRDPDSAAPVHARATVRPEKAAAVAELAAAFRSSSAAVLTEYRGLTVKQVTALRVALGEGATYSIVKNTLTRLAAADAGLEGLDALLAGPTAVAFVTGEPVEAAKALRDYARANPALVVKGGVLAGKPMTAEEIRKLADLESREVLLAKMAGALKASLTGAVQLFAAPLAQTARLAEALRAKAELDPSVLRGGAGTPADAEPATGQSGDTVTGEQEPALVAEDETVVRDSEPVDTTPASQPATGAPTDGEPATGQSGDTTPGD